MIYAYLRTGCKYDRRFEFKEFLSEDSFLNYINDPEIGPFLKVITAIKGEEIKVKPKTVITQYEIE